jgi:cell division septum initiation protein DivIVA
LDKLEEFFVAKERLLEENEELLEKVGYFEKT